MPQPRPLLTFHVKKPSQDSSWNQAPWLATASEAASTMLGQGHMLVLIGLAPFAVSYAAAFTSTPSVSTLGNKASCARLDSPHQRHCACLGSTRDDTRQSTTTAIHGSCIHRRKGSDGYPCGYGYRVGYGYGGSGSRRRTVRVVAMVSEREEELKAKIAKLRGATSKGDSYENVVGKGADLTEKMSRSKGEFEGEYDRARQEKVRAGVVVKGKKDAAVSELAEGRRTIVRDPDDPAFEANILDSLMVSNEEEVTADLEAAYMPTSASETSSATDPGKSFDGAFGSTMGAAEAFFSKPSPFQKAAQEEARAALAAAEDAIAAPSASEGSGSSMAAELAKASKDRAREGVGGEVGEVPPSGVEDDNTDEQNTGQSGSDDAAFQKITGSVGGRWEKPAEGAEEDTHKPVVSTWGVFERPKDISKAFGGGRDPTIRKLDPEEQRRRDEETQAMLRSYRGSGEEDLEREKQSEPEIKAALAQAKRAMKFGDAYGAVSVLEAVKQECSTHGPLGAVVFLELAMALEVTGRPDQSQKIYKVLRRSKNREVRSQAKRLNEGLQAMEFLKFDQPGAGDSQSEISKMWTTNYQQMDKSEDKCYDSTFFEKDADGKPSGSNVFAVHDAKEILMSAYKYGGGISTKRVLRAFDFLRKRSDEASLAARREANAMQQREKRLQEDEKRSAESSTERSDSQSKRRRSPWEPEEAALPQEGAGLMSLLGSVDSLEERVTGGWKLVMRAGGTKVDVMGREGSLTLTPGGALSAVEPAGPVSVAKEGEWQFDTQQRTIKLDYKSSKLVGFVDVGGGQESLEVLALDDRLLVASEAPSKARGAFKYKLLIRQ